jgi:hypothetical protein
MFHRTGIGCKVSALRGPTWGYCTCTHFCVISSKNQIGHDKRNPGDFKVEQVLLQHYCQKKVVQCVRAAAVEMVPSPLSYIEPPSCQESMQSDQKLQHDKQTPTPAAPMNRARTSRQHQPMAGRWPPANKGQSKGQPSSHQNHQLVVLHTHEDPRKMFLKDISERSQKDRRHTTPPLRQDCTRPSQGLAL